MIGSASGVFVPLFSPETDFASLPDDYSDWQTAKCLIDRGLTGQFATAPRSFARLARASGLLLLDSATSAGSDLPRPSDLPSLGKSLFWSEVIENQVFALMKKVTFHGAQRGGQ